MRYLELKRLAVIVGECALSRVETVSCDSQRVCAIRICNTQFSLLLINVYLSHEDVGNNIRELGLQLAVI